ncbi:unnamed protein product [Absidia cylindrospora]
MTFINSTLTTISTNSTTKSVSKKKTGQSTKGNRHSPKHKSIFIFEMPKNQFITTDDTYSDIDTDPISPPPQLPSPNGTEQLDDTASQKEDTKLYSCPKCQQSFSRPHNLKSHLATHSSERPYKCDDCDAHFRRHHDLKRHQKLHTGEKPFVCQVCSRSFARSDALNRHQRVDGDIRCSMAQRHCIMPFSVAPLQQTTPASASSTHKNSSSATATSMTFSFPTASNTQPIANGSPPHIPMRSSPPSPSYSFSSSSASSSSASPPPMPLLPSPSTLSALPLSNDTNLSPLHNIPVSDTTTKHHPHHQPLITIDPPSPSFEPTLLYQQRTLPVPITNVIPSPSSPKPLPLSPSPLYMPSLTSTLDSTLKNRYDHWRDQEINQMKQEHERQMDRLANQVHDLEVENKVLRSLVLQTKQQRHFPQEPYTPGTDGYPKKRSRQSSLNTIPTTPLLDAAKQDLPFAKKSRFSI